MGSNGPASNIPDIARILLPVEVIERIILEAWSSPLSTDDRTTMFTALCLTNRTMLSIFIHIALRDVHITTPRFAEHYLRMLRTRTSTEADDDYLLTEASATANRLCRTMIFHVDAKPYRDPWPDESAVRLYSDGNKEAETVSNTLYVIDLMKNCVPNLRRVTVEYHNWGFDDVFDQCRLLPMPKQVTELELKYSFSKDLRRVVHGLRRRYGANPHHCTRWVMSQTTKLSVHGAPARFVSDLLETTPNVETLEVDDCVKLTQMKGLPSRVRKLVLRTAHPPRTNAGADNWTLAKAVKAESLFKPPRELVITLEGAGTNVRSRERLRKACNGAGIRVRFEE